MPPTVEKERKKCFVRVMASEVEEIYIRRFSRRTRDLLLLRISALNEVKIRVYFYLSLESWGCWEVENVSLRFVSRLVEFGWLLMESDLHLRTQQTLGSFVFYTCDRKNGFYKCKCHLCKYFICEIHYNIC